MRKSYIILLLCLFSLATYSQETVELYYNRIWHLTTKENAQYIRKAALNVGELQFNGKVTDFNKAGILLMEGEFKYNKRNGFFKFYFSDGKLKCEGKFTDNQRDSIWNFYNEKGELTQVIDFTKTDFIVHKFIDEDGKVLVENGSGRWKNKFENEYVKESNGRIGIYRETYDVTGRMKNYQRTGSWIVKRLDDNKVLQSLYYTNGTLPANPEFRYPEFPDIEKYKLETTTSFKVDNNIFDENIRFLKPDKFLSIVTGREIKIKNRSAGYALGEKSLSEFIEANIKYPANCQIKDIEETIYVEVKIDKNGKAIGYKIYIGENEKLKAEAIRVVRLIDNWIPAVKNYENCASSIVVPVKFMQKGSYAQNSNPIQSDNQQKKKVKGDIQIQSKTSLAEKIYLQLDGNVYTTGNIVWFKCVVLDAHSHVPSRLSRVLYVELITPQETIHKKKLIKIDNGIGQGFFYLDKDLPGGLYLIRAYTQWNKNFGTDFFFKEYIRVFTHQKGETAPISNITLVKKQNNEQEIKACFNPTVIDDSQKSKLTVFVTLGNKKDSLYLKKRKDNKYWLDYTISGESEFVTLQMQTENQLSYAKTVVINEDFIDLQFFPESGELVHGLKSKVGFKALDANGKGKIVQGDIVDDRDNFIAHFKSNSLGMGSFWLLKADSTKKYFARLKSQSEEVKTLVYELPRVASKGNVLLVEKQGNKMLLTASSNYLENDSINLDISFRGVRFYDEKFALHNGVFSLLVPVDSLPEGIIAYTMKDNLMRPVAERLYFNERPESRMKIAVSTNKNTYAKRELTNLKIETTNSRREPMEANLSVLVINKQQLGEMQNTRLNILTYFLLESELKGKIENPGFYFRNDSDRFNDLDALMLTQGWRKYNYSKQYEELSFQPEPALTVTGHVSGILSEKKRKNAELTFMTFGKTGHVYTQSADSLGNFKFNLNDEYGDEINVLLQTSKKSGKKMNYKVSLDKKKSPPVTSFHENIIGKADSIMKFFVEKNVERDKIEKAFPLQTGDILLDEVEVKGYRMTPDRKRIMESYGEPTEVIDGDKIRDEKEKWSYGLYSVLMHKFPDKISIRRENGILYAKVLNSDMTLFIIDGKPVSPRDYPYIPNIPTSEVSSFEIIRCAKNFSKLYYEIFNGLLPKNIMCGSIISIYTHSGNGIYSRSPVGLMQATIPVFCSPREFYAPKYDNVKPDDWNKPDLRALIHWEPILKTDSFGKASVSFYNADNPGKMMVIVEAISENGKIAYKEIEYNVDGKEKEIIIVN